MIFIINIKNIKNMKNLFNNISKEEKNRILEMHSGKKRVIYEQQTSNCVTTDEIVNLLTSFKFKVVDQNSAQIILERGPSPKMAHNIKNYIITIMAQNHTIKFDCIHFSTWLALLQSHRL
jgi:hypothetical protein